MRMGVQLGPRAFRHYVPTSLVTRVMWRHFLLLPTCSLARSLACEPTTNNERTNKRERLLGVVHSSSPRRVPPAHTVAYDYERAGLHLI